MAWVIKFISYWKISSTVKTYRALCDSMGGSGEHYASEISQAVRDKYGHDLLYPWNLINKTNKQAKYNQRH